MEGKSLLANVRPQPSFKFYFRQDGSTYTIAHANENMTIQEALLDTIQKINIQRQLDLTTDTSYYEVYGARKTGQRRNGLPAFSKSQSLGQTCMKNFYIACNPYPKLKSKDSIKSIQTTISLNTQRRSETADSFFDGCFCLRKKSQ